MRLYAQGKALGGNLAYRYWQGQCETPAGRQPCVLFSSDSAKPRNDRIGLGCGSPYIPGRCRFPVCCSFEQKVSQHACKLSSPDVPRSFTNQELPHWPHDLETSCFQLSVSFLRRTSNGLYSGVGVNSHARIAAFVPTLAVTVLYTAPPCSL